MNKPDTLDQKALGAAKRHMGAFAWPTVLLGTAVAATYISTPLLVAAGLMPLLVAMPLMAILTYTAYTVLHDAAHGSISGSQTSLRWLNETMGYLAAWILMIPLNAHRHEHLAHHRHTNDSEQDPDFLVSNMARSPYHAVRAAVQVLLGQYRYYARHRWGKGPRKQDVYLVLEVIAALAPRLAFLASGFWLEGVAMFLVAWLVGIAALLYLFAYIVHTPHEAVGRWVDTSTILVDGAFGRLVTWLWLFQNYHSIHHLYPRVPFYHYRELYGEIEGTMIARGAPIYRLGPGGLRALHGHSFELRQPPVVKVSAPCSHP